MDGLDRAERRKSLTERLGLKGMSCCGATWVLSPSPTAISVRDDDVEEEGPQIDLEPNIPTASEPVPPCVDQSPAAGGMNLAAALAEERQLRALLDLENDLSPRSSRPRPDSNDDERSPSTNGTAAGTPLRVSLMRLLEEADGYDGEIKKEEDRGGCDQSVFKGDVVEPRLLSPLQPYDP
ncbi:hypothetical protein ACJIZ3_012787 [Penstemon smallii]|uniref:Uncharacterized protein n=1 Tax=Penstemon smallii TaxID=265156 RepID=A0ABD3UPC6_9LAMI